jgi:hypothetical protein
MSSIPNIYLPPTGGPLYWGNEESGVLSAAVRAYFEAATNPTAPAPSAAQIELLRDYLQYYVQAPCWRRYPDGTGPDAETALKLDSLVQIVPTIRTVSEISRFCDECMEIGLDPL